ncbi:hypothetical protein BpHYR1_004618 [Brachionus plicatilis]|uniref:Uncharacterized protein n=1 Tax=Brachionus plicatilis TaxID=10195 RepID=A0A3M7S7B0_BRAPC|nr:hypothetical protein BpHYR1_004618 [Brachionus plicatilis]
MRPILGIFLSMLLIEMMICVPVVRRDMFSDMMEHNRKMAAANNEFFQKMAKQNLNQNLNLFKSNVGSGSIYLDGKKYSYKNGLLIDQATNKALAKQESDQVLKRLEQSQKLTLDTFKFV